MTTPENDSTLGKAPPRRSLKELKAGKQRSREAGNDPNDEPPKLAAPGVHD